jgi:hypothetical protein
MTNKVKIYPRWGKTFCSVLLPVDAPQVRISIPFRETGISLSFCEADILFNIPIIRDEKNPSILAKANSG